jgi:ubiquinone/menaquinone biosynthesis C-methylase UbiE
VISARSSCNIEACKYLKGGNDLSENTPTSVSPEIIDRLDWEGLKYTAIKVALELDIFDIIAKGYCTADEIARAAKCNKRGIRILLDALCPLEFLAKSGDQYSLTAPSGAFLVRDQPTYCADVYLAWWKSREHLAEYIRTGEAGLDFASQDSEGLWAMLTARQTITWPRHVENARKIWKELGIDSTSWPGVRILDVACGSGVNTFVLAQSDPNVHVSALDFPQVLEVSTQIADAMGVSQQVTFCPGDVMTSEMAVDEFDIVHFGAILYYFGPDQVKSIIQKAWRALRSDGILVIRALIADEERCQSMPALLAALELFHDAPHSQVYTFSEYEAFVKEAGFTDVTQYGDRLISARKR